MIHTFQDPQREFLQASFPCPQPLADAVDAGVFGYDENRVVIPDIEDVRSLTEEHARELVCILQDLDHVRRCAQGGIDPDRQKIPRGHVCHAKVAERLKSEAAHLACHYDDALAAYADGFGWEAADELDRYVRALCQRTGSVELPRIQRELF